MTMSKNNESSDQSQDDLGAYKGPLDLHTILENPDSLAPFRYLNPKITLLSCSRKILNETTNVVKQNLLGSVLITSSGEPLIWKDQDLYDNNKKHTSIVQNTNNEDDYIEIEEDEDDNDISLWTSISNDDTDDDALSDSELTNNFNETLVNQEYIVKDRRAKWPLSNLFLDNIEAPFFATNI
ncbi:16036_t:CDS:2 [Gigaspora rosea]|nr:16036_t:CDS:2 [Gigaspora rosea]